MHQALHPRNVIDSISQEKKAEEDSPVLMTA